MTVFPNTRSTVR